MKLYKFFSFKERNINSIKDKKIWLSAPSRFNDLKECKITALGKIENDHTGQDFNKIKDCIDTLYSESYCYPNPLQKKTIDKLKEFIKREKPRNLPQILNDKSLTPSINNHVRDQSGVACFTGEKGARNNLLMWAHYAENHQGFCIEYEYDERKLSLSEVTYSSKPLTVTAKEILFTPDEVFTRLLTTKGIEWMYEDEWRIIELNCLENHEIGKGKLIDTPEYLVPKRIITGDRFQENKNSHHKKKIYDDFDDTKEYLKKHLGIETINYKIFTQETS